MRLGIDIGLNRIGGGVLPFDDAAYAATIRGYMGYYNQDTIQASGSDVTGWTEANGNVLDMTTASGNEPVYNAVNNTVDFGTSGLSSAHFVPPVYPSAIKEMVVFLQVDPTIHTWTYYHDIAGGTTRNGTVNARVTFEEDLNSLWSHYQPDGYLCWNAWRNESILPTRNMIMLSVVVPAGFNPGVLFNRDALGRSMLGEVAGVLILSEEQTEAERAAILASLGEPTYNTIVATDSLADHAYCRNLTTDTTLFSKDISSTFLVASMTKLMTAFIAAEYLEDQGLDWSETITALSTDDGVSASGSTNWLVDGTDYTMQDLAAVALCRSSNGAAQVLGRGITDLINARDGTSLTIRNVLNNRAAALGMTNTVYTTPSGLGTGYTSAEDQMILLTAIQASTAANAVPAGGQSMVQMMQNTSYTTDDPAGTATATTVDAAADPVLNEVFADQGTLALKGGSLGGATGSCAGGFVTRRDGEVVAFVSGGTTDANRWADCMWFMQRHGVQLS